MTGRKQTHVAHSTSLPSHLDEQCMSSDTRLSFHILSTGMMGKLTTYRLDNQPTYQRQTPITVANTAINASAGISQSIRLSSVVFGGSSCVQCLPRRCRALLKSSARLFPRGNIRSPLSSSLSARCGLRKRPHISPRRVASANGAQNSGSQAIAHPQRQPSWRSWIASRGACRSSISRAA